MLYDCKLGRYNNLQLSLPFLCMYLAILVSIILIYVGIYRDTVVLKGLH